MPVQKESRIGQWIAALREWSPTLRVRLGEWIEAVRAEPALIWATPTVRYSVYGLGGIIGACLLIWGLEQFQPPQAAPPARTADYHVLCTNPACRQHFVINERFNFDGFPVTCPQCSKTTGQRALRCASDTCRRRWVVPVERDGAFHCPYCDGYLGEAD
jgi:hypothetical protein